MAFISTLPISHVQHMKSRSSVRGVQVGQVQNLQIQHGVRMGCAPYSWVCSQNMWCVKLWASLRAAPTHTSNSQCAISSRALISPPAKDILRAIAISCTRVLAGLKACPFLLDTAPAIGLLLFTTYGLLPFMQLIRGCLFKDQDLYKSQMKHILSSYVRPLLLWMGVISICRAFDPVVLSSGASQAIKERFINFVRSLSTVLAFALCTTNLVHQVQKSMEKPDADKGRNLGIQFIGNAVCTSVWVAAVCLFMELLGFSTQKWITAGGFGTVLVTLSGREIFTNFLSSVMIHATRPFIETQWIQAKIEGQEVSGTVEHVGWWSPTVVRGDDREAVHIPNHKFSVSVVRNLSQKTHWRIKTHLAISHLDVGKITLIVSDMRKVLAKQSQVEHKRLHRRVFLDYIHPENQALLILVSCFVKTSHFEEYLRVKETVLLDLLKVISHHNARLATPIRSVQRVSADDSQQSAVRNGHEYERPLFLTESSIFSRSDEAQPTRDYKLSRSKSQSEILTGKAESIVDDSLSKSRASGGKNDLGSGQSLSKSQLEGLDSMGLNSKDITLLGAAFEKPPVKIPDGSQTQPGGETNELIEGHFRRDAEKFDADDLIEDSSQIKRGKIFVQDHVKEQIVESIRSAEEKKATTSRPQSVQDNLVLGVVLDGAKRTLPLDSKKMSSSEQTRNGNGNSGSRERAEMPKPASSTDGRERER